MRSALDIWTLRCEYVSVLTEGSNNDSVPLSGPKVSIM